MNRFKRRLFCYLALRYPWCQGLLPASTPLRVCYYEWAKAPTELMVFLPGIGDIPEDYGSRGFIEAIRQRGIPTAIAVVDAHYGYYAKRTVLERLREDIIAPAKARGFERVWLVGISLGGAGALLYAREHPRDIDGLVVLAPFLGHPPVIEEIRCVGGVCQWQPGHIEEGDYARGLWQWLKRYSHPAPDLPLLYLGYGEHDSFASANRLLAEILPESHVFVTTGGHDWPTWKRLWEQFLSKHDKPSIQSG